MKILIITFSDNAFAVSPAGVDLTDYINKPNIWIYNEHGAPALTLGTRIKDGEPVPTKASELGATNIIQPGELPSGSPSDWVLRADGGGPRARTAGEQAAKDAADAVVTTEAARTKHVQDSINAELAEDDKQRHRAAINRARQSDAITDQERDDELAKV